MTKKELEKTIELRNKELEIIYNYIKEIEDLSIFTFEEILKVSIELNNPEIQVKLKKLILNFLKKRKELIKNTAKD